MESCGFVVSLVSVIRSWFWDGGCICCWVVGSGAGLCDFGSFDEFWSALLPASGSKNVWSGICVVMLFRVKRRSGVGFGVE